MCLLRLSKGVPEGKRSIYDNVEGAKEMKGINDLIGDYCARSTYFTSAIFASTNFPGIYWERHRKAAPVDLFYKRHSNMPPSWNVAAMNNTIHNAPPFAQTGLEKV